MLPQNKHKKSAILREQSSSGDELLDNFENSRAKPSSDDYIEGDQLKQITRKNYEMTVPLMRQKLSNQPPLSNIVMTTMQPKKILILNP